MADEQYKWLTGDMAERLLRGESLEAVGTPAPAQARKLADALGALSADAAPATGELPGEQGALAAFRKVREEAEAERAAAEFGAGGGSGPGARDADAGLVRIGRPAHTGIRSRRPRWARPVRFALAAAVAAGTLGGVAVAAGGGVLPNPFRDEHPGPVTSVSAAQSSGRPTATSSPRPPLNIAPGTPDGSAAPSLGGSPSGTAAVPGRGAGEQVTPGPGDPSRTSGTWWRDAAAACRDLRDGKELGTDRQRALENLAGGPVRVTRYCRAVLAEQNGSAGEDKGQGGDTDGGKGKGKGDGKGEGDGKGDGSGQGDDDGHPGRGPGRDQGGHGGRHRGSVVFPAPSAFAPVTPGRRPTAPAPSPSPSYSAL